jgi:hypothetical protein
VKLRRHSPVETPTSRSLLPTSTANAWTAKTTHCHYDLRGILHSCLRSPAFPSRHNKKERELERFGLISSFQCAEAYSILSPLFPFPFGFTCLSVEAETTSQAVVAFRSGSFLLWFSLLLFIRPCITVRFNSLATPPTEETRTFSPVYLVGVDASVAPERRRDCGLQAEHTHSHIYSIKKSYTSPYHSIFDTSSTTFLSSSENFVVFASAAGPVNLSR